MIFKTHKLYLINRSTENAISISSGIIPKTMCFVLCNTVNIQQLLHLYFQH